ncbi:hypothetical protein PG984_010032 [Apiospora sp. TS-2023a]
MGRLQMDLPDNQDNMSYLLGRAEADHQAAEAYQSRQPFADNNLLGEALYGNIHTPTYQTAQAHGGASSLESGNAVYHGQLEASPGSSYLAHNVEPGTSYRSRTDSWQPATAPTAPMGDDNVSHWSGGQDAAAGPSKVAPRKSDGRPEIPRAYLSDEKPEVRSYLQKYLYNKDGGWELSKLCDSCVMEDLSAVKCKRGGSDDKCTPCRDKGKGYPCRLSRYMAAKASFKEKARQEKSRQEKARREKPRQEKQRQKIDREESYAEKLTRERREKRQKEKQDKAREAEEQRERWREEQRRRPIEESCVYQPPSAPIIHTDDETSGAGVGVPSYNSQPAASALAYQLPVSMCSEAVASYWSTAPSESDASSIYGGTGYDRASFSTASSSIPDDYTTGSSHAPVLSYSTHAATNQYGDSSGTFMMPTGSYTKRNA